MSPQRYERIANDDNDTPTTPQIPNSPPPSFRSRASSPSSLTSSSQRRHHEPVDPNLAETFGADEEDSDEDNDGDDRQRLMRGAPSASSTFATATAGSQSQTPATTTTTTTTTADGERREPTIERRATHLPVFAPTTGRVYGGGTASDGVFANLSAKPETGVKVEEHPPSYEQAAADAAPPYWETIYTPGLGGADEIYVEGLPVGSVFSFVWNGMISMSFQLVGFLLTYLLHTTHAAKNGSRAGLGITLVQYGFYMKGSGSGVVSPPAANGQDSAYASPSDPNSHDFDPGQMPGDGSGGGGGGGAGYSLRNMPSSEWLAYILMIVGWFILIRSVSDFLKARRREQLILQSPERGLNVPVIASDEPAETVV